MNNPPDENVKPPVETPKDPLLESILEYVKKRDRNYAIGLEGDWGSGKTRYLDTVVKPKLANEGLTLIRVSLYGVQSREELYDAIASDYILSHSGDSKPKKKLSELAKAALHLVPKAAKAISSKLGLNITFDNSMKPFVDLVVNREKDVLVFDDLERRAGDRNNNALFGVINDLVEKKGVKAILVSNSLTDTGENPSDSLNPTIREKLVWEVYRFSPDPAALARNILGTISNDAAGFDVLDAVAKAANEVQCRNARALIRAEKQISRLSMLPCISDEAFDISGRENTLRAAIRHCLQISMGKAPEEPTKPDLDDAFSPEYSDYLFQKRAYDEYSELSLIDKMFDLLGTISDDELDAELRSFMKANYPDSCNTVALREIIKKIDNVWMMEDEDIEADIPAFRELVKSGNYSPTIIWDVIRYNDELSSQGFQGLLDKEELLESCKTAIESDPETAFHQSVNRIAAQFKCRNDEFVGVLAEYSAEAYRKQILDQELALIDTNESGCGESLADIMTKLCSKNFQEVFLIEPEIIRDCFFGSNAQGQEAIRYSIHKLHDYLFAYYNEAEKWLLALKEDLDSRQAPSLLGEMRKRWLSNDLEKLIENQVRQKDFHERSDNTTTKLETPDHDDAQ